MIRSFLFSKSMFLTSEMYRNGKKYNLVVVVRESKIPKEVKEKLFSVDEYSLRVVLKDVSSSPNVSETIDSLFNIAKKKIYINYGYLVFEFNKKNLELESFDAYVVPEYKTIEVPKSFIPSIMCLNKKDVNLLEDDRFTINIKPKYYYDKKIKSLKYSLAMKFIILIRLLKIYLYLWMIKIIYKKL